MAALKRPSHSGVGRQYKLGWGGGVGWEGQGGWVPRGKAKREREKEASKKCRPCKAPSASTCQGNIVFCPRQAFYCCPGERVKKREREKTLASAIHTPEWRASEQAGLFMSQAACQKVLFFPPDCLFCLLASACPPLKHTGRLQLMFRRMLWCGIGGFRTRGLRKLIVSCFGLVCFLLLFWCNTFFYAVTLIN